MERFPRNKTTKLYTVSSRASLLDPGSSLLETTTRLNTMSSRPASRDPVTWGGKICLPQRPEVSFKQATPLHLPNRLQQPNTRQPMGWQSPFATETGGLLQTGNCVAPAEQSSAAQYSAAQGWQSVTTSCANQAQWFLYMQFSLRLYIYPLSLSGGLTFMLTSISHPIKKKHHDGLR